MSQKASITLDCILQMTITKILVTSDMAFTSLLGNFFQLWSFLFSIIHFTWAGGHFKPAYHSSNCTLRTLLLVKIKIILRPTVSRPVGQSVLVSGRHLEFATNFTFISMENIFYICGFLLVGQPPCREDGSVTYMCKCY
jgi:hypothetical protein